MCYLNRRSDKGGGELDFLPFGIFDGNKMMPKSFSFVALL